VCVCVFSCLAFIFTRIHYKVQAAAPVFICMDTTDALQGLQWDFGCSRTLRSGGDPGAICEMRLDL